MIQKTFTKHKRIYYPDCASSRSQSSLLVPSMPPKYSPVPVIVIPSTTGPIIRTFLTEGEAAAYTDYVNWIIATEHPDRKTRMPYFWLPFPV